MNRIDKYQTVNDYFNSHFGKIAEVIDRITENELDKKTNDEILDEKLSFLIKRKPIISFESEEVKQEVVTVDANELIKKYPGIDLSSGQKVPKVGFKFIYSFQGDKLFFELSSSFSSKIHFPIFLDAKKIGFIVPSDWANPDFPISEVSQNAVRQERNVFFQLLVETTEQVFNEYESKLAEIRNNLTSLLETRRNRIIVARTNLENIKNAS